MMVKKPTIESRRLKIESLSFWRSPVVVRQTCFYEQRITNHVFQPSRNLQLDLSVFTLDSVPYENPRP